MSIPVWYTPVTTAQLKLFSNQKGPCADFELDYFRCSSRVGKTKSVMDCKKEFDDFAECSTRRKEFERYVIMYKERKRQGRPTIPAPHPDVAGVV